MIAMLKTKPGFSILLLCCSLFSWAQSHTITGKISSGDNAMLSGATIQLKDSKNIIICAHTNRFSEKAEFSDTRIVHPAPDSICE